MPQSSSPKPDSPKSDSWLDRHLWQIQPVRDLMTVAAIFGLIWFGYTIRVVTVPLLLAIGLAYMLEPIVQRLTRSGRLSRSTAAGLIVVVGVLGVVLPTLVGIGFGSVQAIRSTQSLVRNAEWLVKSVESPEAIDLKARSPGPTWEKMRDWIAQQRLRELEADRRLAMEQEEREHAATALAAREARAVEQKVLPPDSWLDPMTSPRLYIEGPRGVQSITWDAYEPHPPKEVLPPANPTIGDPSPGYQIADWVMSWVRENREILGRQALRSGVEWVNSTVKGLTAVGYAIFIASLTVFFFFFVSSEYGRVRTFWTGLIPDASRAKMIDTLQKMDRVISGFIRGRLTICAALMLYYTIAYWAIGVPAWLILGPVVGLLSLLPYMANLGMAVAMLLMLLDSTGGYSGNLYWIIGAPIGVSILAQVLDDYILTPTIQGKETGMDTPSILFASIAGGSIAGIYGLLIAIPVAACVKILLAEWFWPRFRAWVAGRAADFLPISNK